MLANRENVKIIEDSTSCEDDANIENRVLSNLKLEYLRPIENIFD